MSTGGTSTCNLRILCIVLEVGRVPVGRSLNEQSLEPQKVAQEPQTTNFDDVATTFPISNIQLMKQLLLIGETISYK